VPFSIGRLVRVRTGWLAAFGVACALVAPGLASAGPGLLIGVDDDSVKWAPSPADVVAAHRDVGFTADRVTIQWHTGLTKLDQDGITYVARAQAAAKLGERVILAVYGPPDQAPRTQDERDDYCSFVVSALGAARNVYDVVIWNEANSAFFWRPQATSGIDYENLLETCYDAIHQARKNVDVITSVAGHENPLRFIRQLRAGILANDRTGPIFDTFGYDPYPETSMESPFAQHLGTTSVDEGDYTTLLNALTAAFTGTGQPIPGSGVATAGSVPPGGVPAAALAPQPTRRRTPVPEVVVPDGPVTIWYLEDGFETIVPPKHRGAYTGKETHTLLVPALFYDGATNAVGRDQSSQIRDALELAYCQPAVGAWFNFQLTDEASLAGWQSGLLWADGTRKPSYPIVKEAVTAVAAGAIDCSQLPAAATGLAPLPAIAAQLGNAPQPGAVGGTP
jgi:hypothetical protein